MLSNWYWRNLLRVLWTARRSNQLILKEITPEYSLEGFTLKVKLQYFGHLMQRADSLEKILMQGTIEGKRRRVWQRMRCLYSITELMDMNLCKLWGTVKEVGPSVLQPTGLQRVRRDLVTEQQQRYFFLGVSLLKIPIFIF